LFAMVFTFSCSSGGGGGGDDDSSSSVEVVGGGSSSSAGGGIAGSSSSSDNIVSSSSAENIVVSSSSVDNGSSSSSSVGGISSSSIADVISSSSANGSSSSSVGGVSSSSVADVGSSSSVTGGGDVQFNENSQIYNRDYDDNGSWHIGDAYNGSGVIKLVAYNNGNEILINAGSVTNGIVNLNLPQTINLPDEYFRNLIDEDEQSYCTDYPTDIKIVVPDGFKLFDSNEELLGRLYIQYRDEQIREYIEYWYLTKAGKITCDLGSAIVKMDANVGWNKTYYHKNYVGNSIIERSTTNILTKEVKWFILD